MYEQLQYQAAATVKAIMPPPPQPVLLAGEPTPPQPALPAGEPTPPPPRRVKPPPNPPPPQHEQPLVTIKQIIGEWTIWSDDRGEYYYNAVTKNSFSKPPPELLALCKQQQPPQQPQLPKDEPATLAKSKYKAPPAEVIEQQRLNWRQETPSTPLTSVLLPKAPPKPPDSAAPEEVPAATAARMPTQAATPMAPPQKPVRVTKATPILLAEAPSDCSQHKLRHLMWSAP